MVSDALCQYKVASTVTFWNQLYRAQRDRHIDINNIELNETVTFKYNNTYFLNCYDIFLF